MIDSKCLSDEQRDGWADVCCKPNPHLWKTVAQQGFPLPPATYLLTVSRCSWILSPANHRAWQLHYIPGPRLFFAGPEMGGLGWGGGSEEWERAQGQRHTPEWSRTFPGRKKGCSCRGAHAQAGAGLRRAFASKPETLGQNRPKWATSPPPGKISVTVAAPAPQQMPVAAPDHGRWC